MMITGDRNTWLHYPWFIASTSGCPGLPWASLLRSSVQTAATRGYPPVVWPSFITTIGLPPGGHWMTPGNTGEELMEGNLALSPIDPLSFRAVLFREVDNVNRVSRKAIRAISPIESHSGPGSMLITGRYPGGPAGCNLIGSGPSRAIGAVSHSSTSPFLRHLPRYPPRRAGRQVEQLPSHSSHLKRPSTER